MNVGDGWQAAGATTQITAAADAYYHFTNWTGDVSAFVNPLELLMAGPRQVQAVFEENLAAHDTPE